MTDRVHSLIVVLDHDIRVDDVESITNAIGMLKGVLTVSGKISDLTSHMAEERARYELGQKIFDVVYPDRSK